jgi:DNA-binding winged helix-turn-helix (wHTH) protein
VVHAFHEYRLCTLRRVLLRDDSEIRLRRKAYECLRYLIEQSPRAVSKDELCDAVWSPRVISNETLTSTIKDVREALDDQLEPRRYVRTLFGFGYRFVAPLESPDPQRPEPVAGSGRHAQPLEHA